MKIIRRSCIWVTLAKSQGDTSVKRAPLSSLFRINFEFRPFQTVNNNLHRSLSCKKSIFCRLWFICEYVAFGKLQQLYLLTVSRKRRHVLCFAIFGYLKIIDKIIKSKSARAEIVARSFPGHHQVALVPDQVPIGKMSPDRKCNVGNEGRLPDHELPIRIG